MDDQDDLLADTKHEVDEADDFLEEDVTEDDELGDDPDELGLDRSTARNLPVGSDHPPLVLSLTSDGPTPDMPLPHVRKRPSMFEPPTGKDWDDLKPEEKKRKLRELQQECLRREGVILNLIKLRQATSRRSLPPGILVDAKQDVRKWASWKKQGEVTDRWIQQLMRDYLIYRTLYPHDPSAEFFMPLPMGRPSGQLLTDQQKSVIRYALATRARQVKSALGRVREIELPFEYREVWKFASSICPMPSYDTVRRYLHSFCEANPALFKLMTEGDDVVERDLLLKKRNDVQRPNERWQSDARDLPWYVLYNGKPHRVALIIVYDDYSGYIIWWRLVVKQEKEDAAWIATPRGQRRMGFTGKKGRRSSTFTGLDVIRLYLTAMYRIGIRPERIYTDNGSQFIAAEKYLSLLTRANEPPIEVSHTRPGKPWGRGKIENSLGQLNRLLKRLPGTYNKRNRKSIRDAMHHKELYTFEEAEAELAKHFKELNERPRKKAPSRFDVWRSVRSLPAPPIRQMAFIEDIAAEQKEVTVTGWNISFDGREWEPKSLEGKNRQIYRRWMDAAASDEKAWLCAVRLDTGLKVEVRLGDLWIELVPKADQVADQKHNEDQARSLKDAREERKALLDADGKVVMELTGGTLPVAEASSGDYTVPIVEPSRVQPQPEDRNAAAAVDTKTEAAAGQEPTAEAKGSTRGRRRKQADDRLPATAQPTPATDEDDDLSGLPSLAEQIRKVETQLRGNT